MGDFKSDLLGAVGSRGNGDIADAIGMPDQQDYEALLKIINKFQSERFWDEDNQCYVTGGYLTEYALKQARMHYQNGIHAHKKHSLVNEASGMRYGLELNGILMTRIERVFPSMFRSKKHLRWFTRKFPGLTVSGKSL
jgi:hypothetical protein